MNPNKDLLAKSPCSFLKPQVSEDTFSPRNKVLLDGFVCSETHLSLMEEKSNAYTTKSLVDLVRKLFFDEMFLPISPLDAVTVLWYVFSKILFTCNIFDGAVSTGGKGTTGSLCYFHFSIFTIHATINIWNKMATCLL